MMTSAIKGTYKKEGNISQHEAITLRIVDTKVVAQRVKVTCLHKEVGWDEREEVLEEKVLASF